MGLEGGGVEGVEQRLPYWKRNKKAGCLHHANMDALKGTSEVPRKRPSCPLSLTEASVSAALRGQQVKGTFSAVVKALFKAQLLRV